MFAPILNVPEFCGFLVLFLLRSFFCLLSHCQSGVSFAAVNMLPLYAAAAPQYWETKQINYNKNK